MNAIDHSADKNPLPPCTRQNHLLWLILLRWAYDLTRECLLKTESQHFIEEFCWLNNNNIFVLNEQQQKSAQ